MCKRLIKVWPTFQAWTHLEIRLHILQKTPRKWAISKWWSTQGTMDLANDSDCDGKETKDKLPAILHWDHQSLDHHYALDQLILDILGLCELGSSTHRRSCPHYQVPGRSDQDSHRADTVELCLLCDNLFRLATSRPSCRQQRHTAWLVNRLGQSLQPTAIGTFYPPSWQHHDPLALTRSRAGTRSNVPYDLKAAGWAHHDRKVAVNDAPHWEVESAILQDPQSDVDREHLC